MFRKKQIAAVLIGLATAGTMVSANAAPVTLSAGNIQILLGNYDAGTTGYQPLPPAGSSSTICNTVASCDASAGSHAPGAVGSEDSWGIFSIAQINNLSTGQTLFSSGPGNYMTGIFYGLTDFKVDASTELNTGKTTLSAYSQGGGLNVWQTTSQYLPTLGPAGRIGVSGYNSVSNVGGTLALSAAFTAGVDASQPTATYENSFNSTSIAGSGQGFLDVTGGFLQSALDTNAQMDPNGGFHDLFLDTTFSDANGIASSLGWTVHSATEVTGAVPEPGSMALAGLGLMGLAALRRRKNKG